MYCYYCGHKLRDIAKFCNMCGQPIKEWDDPVIVPKQPDDDPYAFLRNTNKHIDKAPPAPVNKAENLVEEYEPSDDPYASFRPEPKKPEKERTYTQQPVYTQHPVPMQTYIEEDRFAVNIADSELGFLSLNEILIDEKVSVLKFANAFSVYDLTGNRVGSVQQVNISGGAKAARLLLGSNTKGMQKFHYQILDADGKLLASVRRDGGAFSQIKIVDKNDDIIGTLVRGQVVDVNQNPICRFKSDWKGWNLTITDAGGNEIGSVQKRWNGIRKEFFTTADKYHVSVVPTVIGTKRLAVFVMALVYDILLHEFR